MFFCHRVLEVIISEQLDRLNANLQNITKFSSAASTAANQLQELIECEGQVSSGCGMGVVMIMKDNFQCEGQVSKGCGMGVVVVVCCVWPHSHSYESKLTEP